MSEDRDTMRIPRVAPLRRIEEVLIAPPAVVKLA